MDNLTDVLAGALLGQIGLKRLSGRAMPTLIIAANIPDIDALATLPPREELLARLVGMLASPLTRVVGVLNGPIRSLPYVLNARADQLGGGTEAPAEAAAAD